MKRIWLAILICLTAQTLAGAPARAEDAGEPSANACNEFRAAATQALARAPSSLQVNVLFFEAARKGCISAIPMLVKVGASRGARDRLSDTALAIAARMGRLAFVKALLGAGADADELNRANAAGSTPLIQAALANRAEVAKLLVEAGARVEAANAQGESALSAAAFNGNAELARIFLDHKGAPDAADATGKSVIVYAAARGAAPIVAMLLDAGVDVNKRYGADLTALMWAAGHADNAPGAQGLATVKLLIARGAKLDLADDRGRTALMIAAGLGHGEIAQALREAGADPALRDKAGKPAADLASGADIQAIVAAP